MPQPVRILLLDDGELSNVARILEARGLEHTRIRGQQVVGKLSPPSDLLITTSRCAQLVRRGSPKDAPSGRPIRIIGVEDDSSSMRRMLRRMGYHLLVGLPGSDEIWRPLIDRATYRETERRGAHRILVGSRVSVRAGSASLPATLVDLSHRSCRLLVPLALREGDALVLSLSGPTTASRPLALDGRVTRVSKDRGEAFHSLTLAFDPAMSPDTRAELNGVVNLWSVGPPSDHGAKHSPPEPPGAEDAENLRIRVDEETPAAFVVPVSAPGADETP